MSVFDTIKNRRSIRNYSDKTVEEEKLLQVLEAGRLAPSAVNYQPWDIIVVKEPQVKEKLSKASPQAWLIKVPIMIVVCADPNRAWCRKDGEEFWKVDTAIAMQNMVLAAYELGLGTCWIGAFDEKTAKNALNIPDNIRVVALTPLGYPAEQKGQIIDRKNLVEIVHYNHW